MRLKWAIVIVALCVGVPAVAVAYAAGKASSPEVMRAQSIELVDAGGQVRGRMAIGSSTGPALLLYDQEGSVRARLWLSLDGSPSLDLYDAHGRGGVSAFPGTDGNPGVCLRDEEGTLRAGLFAEGLELSNEQGQRTWSAPRRPAASVSHPGQKVGGSRSEVVEEGVESHVGK
jgi:hypothetical protein